MAERKNILLVITGGIAAYKTPELVRHLRKKNYGVRCVLTKSAQQFVTPLTLASLTEQPVYDDLWSLKDETEMGHIRLSREADLIVIAPATANFLAKMAYGLADDLASTTLLAANKPVLAAPAMNHHMWHNPATQNNIETLKARGVLFTGPDEGEMACGEFGYGRMSEPSVIADRVDAFFNRPLLLKGKKALVTSGPTFEAIDPVRYIGNRSSGKQGHAIARALAHLGADVTLVSGPVALPDPAGIRTIKVETAKEMLAACKNALPADIAVFAAAVADWHIVNAPKSKIKKTAGMTGPQLEFAENPDIAATISQLPKGKRPALAIGFAAETDNLIENARQKLTRKKLDWVLANQVDVDNPENVFGSERNSVYLVSHTQDNAWSDMTKDAVASHLADHIAAHFTNTTCEAQSDEHIKFSPTKPAANGNL